MRLKFLSFSNLTLLVALSLSSVAAYYSIIGLTAIFAGAVIPVIIMGSILEVGKITTTVWLRKYWKRAGFLLKLYLVPAVIALALLTSMGIFGFLSKAHMEQGITSGDAQGKVAIYDEKIKTSKDNIDANRKALKQLDEAVDQVMGRSTSEQGADKAVAIRRSQANDRKRLLAEIQAEQKTISQLSEERAPLASELRKVEAEVGPIKYIAALIYGDNADQNMLESAVRWVIILLVVVFDPLAIALVLAANASKEWDNELSDPDPKPTYEPDDGPINEEVLEQLRERAKEELPSSDPTINCYNCGTPLINAPGIGPFCPNKECSVADNTSGSSITWEYIPPEPLNIKPVTVEPEKSILEQHPYLMKGFDHFEGLKPLVAKFDEPVVENVDNSEVISPPKPYEELDGGYAIHKGLHMSLDALKSMHPELFSLTADSNRPVTTNFGIKFPATANKGDVFVRVDMLPNKVFKYMNDRWTEVNKEQSDTYLYNQKYIKHLVDKIDKGEYDVDLLSDQEKEQIEIYLKNQNT